MEDDSEEESDYEGEMGCGNKQMDTLITAKTMLSMSESQLKKEAKRQERLKGIGKGGGVCAPGGQKSCCVIF